MIEEIRRIFPDAHVQSGYVRVRCPYHKDGQERKPSMSILLEPRGNAPRGFCHCFACGKVVMFDKLCSDLGYSFDADLAASPQQNEQREPLSTTPPVYKIQLPFRFSPYLKSRGISEATQERFKVFEKDGMVHMPVFDRSGRYLYDNARSTTGKRFFVEAGASKSLWAVEEVQLDRPIAVCESQIDALSFWEVGCQAVATLGADNVRSLHQIKGCTSKIILAFDPDEAGFRARDRAASMLGVYRCAWLDLPAGVDVNQALQDIGDNEKFKAFMRKCTRTFVHNCTNT